MPKIAAETAWKDLYRLAGVAVLSMAAIIVLSIAGFAIWPYAPGTNTTTEIFTLIQSNRLAGLVVLDLGVTASTPLSLVLYLALFVGLRTVSRSYALVAFAFGMTATAAIIASRPLFEVFALSDLYASSTTEAQRSRYLAAGDTLLLLYHGTAFKLYVLFGAVSLVTSSVLMLRSEWFGRVVGYTGIVGNALSAGFVLPVVGPVFAFASLPVMVVWFLLLSRVFRQLARPGDSLKTL